MFAHVTIRAADRSASERFYRGVLPALGIAPTHDTKAIVAWDDFALLTAEPGSAPTRHLHVGFVAPSRDHVDAFWRAGVGAGYADAGRPGEQPIYRPDYYGAFLLDPDGNSIEAVHHGDTRRGGHIDHLWIGVRDRDASRAFYDAIARHTGLRPGRTWKEGVQYIGAWATFSLVSDGRPPTERLHLAFAVPDRTTVTDFHCAATRAGYVDNGPPGVRPQYGQDYFAAFVLDADGTNVEAVTRAAV